MRACLSLALLGRALKAADKISLSGEEIEQARALHQRRLKGAARSSLASVIAQPGGATAKVGAYGPHEEACR